MEIEGENNIEVISPDTSNHENSDIKDYNLTLNEKRVLAIMFDLKTSDPNRISSVMNEPVSSILQWSRLLEEKGLVKIKRIAHKKYKLTDEGKYYAIHGLPETQILKLITDTTTIDDLKDHPMFKIGFGSLMKKGLIKLENKRVIKIPGANTDDMEEFIHSIYDQEIIESVGNRGNEVVIV